MASRDGDAGKECPVDHTTREKWLESARATNPQADGSARVASSSAAAAPPAITAQPRFSLDTGRWQHDDSLTRRRPEHSQARLRPLPTDREISTIPRSIPTNDDRQPNAAERAAMPSSPSSPSSSSSSHAPIANNEQGTGHDRESGNWIYPSQEMFFNAMKRKGHSAEAGDMATIVPIHNAVNERAWKEIKEWEAGRGSEQCGGPKLVSFAGDSKALTPRARWKGWMGYQEPFDRHDWVVDRCGRRVEYVIDFYAGKDEGVKGKSLNFYLDVRPKLNSWEGISTRAMRFIGI